MMYTTKKVHVPEKYHERIRAAVTQDKPLPVKIDLTSDGDDVIALTPGQLVKIERAMAAGKKVTTIRMSRKQVRANVKVEGGFLSTLLRLATKFLPTLLGGLATGLVSAGVEKAVKGGNGLYLGKKGHGTVQVDIVDGGGAILTPCEYEGRNGLYFRHNGQVFEGKGLLLGENSPFKNVPILGLLF